MRAEAANAPPPEVICEGLDLEGLGFSASPRPGFGLVIEPLSGGGRPELHASLLAPRVRERFFHLVDAHGFVLVRKANSQHSSYRFVRGRSSPGKLSPGEYYHHDGCAGPTKPRVVEIRFPLQGVERQISTAIAPFPAVVYAMVACLPAAPFDRGAIAALGEVGPEMSYEQGEQLQALVMRAARREFSAAEARGYLRRVDERVGAYVHRWQGGDSLFVANNPAGPTFQHRRAYPADAFDGRANGHLVKRWPAEDLAEITLACEVE